MLSRWTPGCASRASGAPPTTITPTLPTPFWLMTHSILSFRTLTEPGKIHHEKRFKVRYRQFLFKGTGPLFNFVEPQYSHLVYPNICIYTITNLWKFGLNYWSLKLQENMKEKHPCCKRLCAFRCLIKCFRLEVFLNLVRHLLFLKNYVTLEAVILIVDCCSVW